MTPIMSDTIGFLTCEVDKRKTLKPGIRSGMSNMPIDRRSYLASQLSETHLMLREYKHGVFAHKFFECVHQDNCAHRVLEPGQIDSRH